MSEQPRRRRRQQMPVEEQNKEIIEQRGENNDIEKALHPAEMTTAGRPEKPAVIQPDKPDDRAQKTEYPRERKNNKSFSVIPLFAVLAVLLIVGGLFLALDNHKPDSGRSTTRKTHGGFEYSIAEDGTATIVRYLGEEADVIIPQSFDDHTVTSLSMKAFDTATQITRVSLPDTILELSGNPFLNCSSLTYIHVSPDHPTMASMDGVLFSTADKKLISYPPNHDDRYYSIPEGITAIGDSAFEKSNLISLEIPESVMSIGKRALSGCKRMDYLSIDAPEGIVLGEYAFSDMTSLENIYLWCDITEIPNGLFSGCSALETISLPSTVEHIGNSAFYMCISLRECRLTSEVTSIGSSAFCGAGIYTFDFPTGITEIPMFAFQLTNIRKLTIPEGVLRIEDYAFSDCEHLEEILLPSSVEYIAESAFRRCPQDAIFTVAQGSYAAQYCKENNLNYAYANGNDWLMP